MAPGDIWGALRALFYSLWVCRVSFLSALGGFALFGLVPEAQSVFLDLHTPGLVIWHWLAFYAAVLFFWMLPVQLSARVMLQAGQDRVEDEDIRWYEYLMVHLPWVLALFCLATVAIGQWQAMSLLPDPPQPDQATPSTPLEAAASTQLHNLLATTIGLVVLWLVAWVVLPRIVSRLTVRHGLLDIAALRFIATVLFGRRATTRGYGASATPLDGDRDGRFTAEQLQSAGAMLALAVILLVSIALVFRSPLEIWPALARAPMFPVFVGAWLPLLTLFAYGAHRLRLPILAGFILLMTTISNLMTGLHDVRLAVESKETGPLEARQATLVDAVGWWRAANGCDKTLGATCNVRPIIVAAEGGASRAGFFTGSLLAQLEDLSNPRGAARAGANAPPFSRQLFAVSTVSGSSLGSAVFAALLEDSQGEAWTRPKPERADDALWFKSGKALGIGGTTPVPLPENPSRKDIVQQILAGDFLTSTIAALSLDLWTPWHARLRSGDRTDTLEKTWELRFSDPSGQTRTPKPGFDRALSKLAPDQSHWRPILIFNGSSITTGKRIITSTLYPLMQSPDDALQVESVFRDSYDAYDLMCRGSDAAHANGECPCVNPASGPLQPLKIDGLQPLRMKGCDIRLSTAVSNSARFPIVSSHGDIVTGDKGSPGRTRVVDRIVDGGYFDYSGIVSALELRAQIMRVDSKLNPLVLFVTNDPGFNPDACTETTPIDELDVLRFPAGLPASPISAQPFSILGYPIEALLTGRVSRAEQSMANAVLLNRSDNITKSFKTAPDQLSKLRTQGLQLFLNFDIVSVGAACNNNKQIRPVPMNWWLSMPTQAYLDSEICAPHNQSTIAGILSQLGEQPDESAQSAGADEAARAKQQQEQLARYLAKERLVRFACGDIGRRWRARQTR